MTDEQISRLCNILKNAQDSGDMALIWQGSSGALYEVVSIFEDERRAVVRQTPLHNPFPLHLVEAEPEEFFLRLQAFVEVVPGRQVAMTPQQAQERARDIIAAALLSVHNEAVERCAEVADAEAKTELALGDEAEASKMSVWLRPADRSYAIASHGHCAAVALSIAERVRALKVETKP